MRVAFFYAMSLWHGIVFLFLGCQPVAPQRLAKPRQPALDVFSYRDDDSTLKQDIAGDSYLHGDHLKEGFCG